MAPHSASLTLLTHPYNRLEPLEPTAEEVRTRGREPGSALVWCMGVRSGHGTGRLVRSRPGGLSLLVVLPPDAQLMSAAGLAMELQEVRPHGILPYHPGPAPSELSQVLRRPPVDLASEVTDYLRWRGLGIDRDTIQLLRRILDLSAELRSITAVSRSMYLSRRALGRRLTIRGLPVPSHWLQVGRLLRVAIRLQNTDATVASVAFEHGYPDGFSLSNQMERLIGRRPSEVRQLLGWEWLVESWLRQEADAGRLRPTAARPDRGSSEEARPKPPAPLTRRPRHRSRVAEG